jgi:hypothetical protein
MSAGGAGRAGLGSGLLVHGLRGQRGHRGLLLLLGALGGHLIGCLLDCLTAALCLFGLPFQRGQDLVAALSCSVPPCLVIRQVSQNGSLRLGVLRLCLLDPGAVRLGLGAVAQPAGVPPLAGDGEAVADLPGPPADVVAAGG